MIFQKLIQKFSTLADKSSLQNHSSSPLFLSLSLFQSKVLTASNTISHQKEKSKNHASQFLSSKSFDQRAFRKRPL